MKKLILTLAIVLGVATISAQEKMWVGGTVNFSSTNVAGEGGDHMSFKFKPEVGYVISDNLAVALSFGAGHGYEEVEGYSFDVNKFIVNPFVRYSFLKGSLGAMFIDAGVGYERWHFNGENTDANYINVGVRPGFALNVSSKFALIGKLGFLGYEHQSFKYKDGDYEDASAVNQYGLNFDLDNIEVGVAFKF